MSHFQDIGGKEVVKSFILIHLLVWGERSVSEIAAHMALPDYIVKETLYQLKKEGRVRCGPNGWSLIEKDKENHGEGLGEN